MHIPVLLNEVIQFLDPKPGEFIIDGTIGSGGHAIEILRRIGSEGKLLGIDWDEKNIEKLKTEKLKDFRNVILVCANYADLPEILKNKNLGKADGLLLDLGLSSDQLEESGRGFSFKKNEPLDMRYNTTIQNSKLNSKNLTAEKVVNQFSEKELADLIYKYGEERFSRRIAKTIIKEREKKPIKTTFDLVEIIKKSVPKNYEKGRIHPATRTFQSLRIYVNNELSNLSKLLTNLEKILNFKGRTIIISYHSLEDRIIKRAFRALEKEGKAEILTKKPIRPTKEEIERNPRSRSAKLRAIVAL
jgi:16S rRNA (cytosine1402-N4)-methyltransferase